MNGTAEKIIEIDEYKYAKECQQYNYNVEDMRLDIVDVAHKQNFRKAYVKAFMKLLTENI